MKNKHIFGATLAIWLLMAPVTYAQITVLPQAEEKADCKNILNEFERTGKMPSASDMQQGQDNAVKSNQENDAAQKALQAAIDAKAAAELALYGSNADPAKCEKWIKDPMSDNPGGLCGEYASAKAQLDSANKALAEAEKSAAAADQAKVNAAKSNAAKDDMRANLLGCGIKTGRISLSMIPYFITYFANYLLSIVAIVSVLFVVLGGYFYIWGGMTEKKDKGKAFITHALIGLGIATLAWIIVNAVMAIFTS